MPVADPTESPIAFSASTPKGLSLLEQTSILHRFRALLSRRYQFFSNSQWPELQGKACLRFYRLLYPQFHVGKHSRIWGRFYVWMIDPLRSEIRIGSDVRMNSEQKRSGLTVFARCKFTVYPNGSIVIGDGVAMTATAITSKKRVEIGANTMISPNVIIADSDFHVPWPPEERWHAPTDAYDKEVRVGSNVWIATNVIILKGVTIGDNSIIGAGSVVTSDIPANVFAAGNPAQVIRSLTGEL